jgi:hypothetical protein
MIIKHLVEQTRQKQQEFKESKIIHIQGPKFQFHVLVYDCETIIHKEHVLFNARESLNEKRFRISPFVGLFNHKRTKKKKILKRDCSCARKRDRNHKRNPLKRPQSNVAFIHSACISFTFVCFLLACHKSTHPNNFERWLLNSIDCTVFQIVFLCS